MKVLLVIADTLRRGRDFFNSGTKDKDAREDFREELRAPVESLQVERPAADPDIEIWFADVENFRFVVPFF